MPAFINVSNTWRSIASLRVNVSGTWRTVTNGYVNVAGTWRTFFTSTLTPSIQFPVTISRNNATFPSTLTGTNYNWTNSTSLTYVFQKSSDNVNFTDIGLPATISNPSSGSSNTVTYALTLSDFPAFTSFFRFAVTAVNSTFSTSATSTSGSVSVNRPAPINTVPPTITPSTGTVGVTQYSVNSNGSWNPDDADGVYEYLWQSFDTPTYISAPGTNNLSTYTPPSNFLALGFQSPIRCRVTATNASGSTAAFSSNTATVLGAALTPTFGANTSVAGGFTGSVTNYDANFTWNTPSVASGTLTAGTFTWSSPVGSTRAFTVSGLGSLASSTVTVITTRSGYNSGSAQTTGTALAAPSASNLATSDTTVTPGAPFSITVANTATANQGQVTWTNGSNATSAWVSSVTPGSSFTGSDGGSLLTSQLFTITSSATAVATVNNKNNNKRVTVSWDQANAASYRVSYTITNAGAANGTFNQDGNSTASSASFTVTLGNVSGTVRANSVTVYSSANQSGVSSTFTPGSAPSTSPTDKTSSNTGSGSVTFTAPAPVNLVAPSVTPTTGTAGVTTYSCTTGTWTNSPTSYAYQWQYNDQGATFLNISGQTNSTYAPPSNFFSFFTSPIRCRVTATNAGGSTQAFSNTASVSSPTVPGTVTSLTASSSLSGTNLNWSASWAAPASDGGSAITGYRIYVERAGSSSGPWLATTTQSPAGTGAFTQASPRLVSSATTSVTGRVTGTSATWIRVWVAAVNAIGTGSYTSAVG
jgi:trimeric autotransporter adhesin